MLKDILTVCRTIESERNIYTIFDHLVSEVNELELELGIFAGEDGIVGEAVDVILCSLDIIYKSNPDITEEEIALTIKRKLDKWQRLYGKGVTQ